MVSLSGTRGVTMLFALFALLALLHVQTCSARSVSSVSSLSHLRAPKKDTSKDNTESKTKVGSKTLVANRDGNEQHGSGSKNGAASNGLDKDIEGEEVKNTVNRQPGIEVAIAMYTAARPCGATKAALEEFIAHMKTEQNVNFDKQPDNQAQVYFGYEPNSNAVNNDGKLILGDLGDYKKDLFSHFDTVFSEYVKLVKPSSQEGGRTELHRTKSQEGTAEGQTLDPRATKEPTGSKETTTDSDEDYKGCFIKEPSTQNVQNAAFSFDEKTDRCKAIRDKALRYGHEALKHCHAFLSKQLPWPSELSDASRQILLRQPHTRFLFQRDSLNLSKLEQFLITHKSVPEESHCLVACGVATAFGYSATYNGGVNSGKKNTDEKSNEKSVKSCSIAVAKRGKRERVFLSFSGGQRSGYNSLDETLKWKDMNEKDVIPTKSVWSDIAVLQKANSKGVQNIHDQALRHISGRMTEFETESNKAFASYNLVLCEQKGMLKEGANKMEVEHNCGTTIHKLSADENKKNTAQVPETNQPGTCSEDKILKVVGEAFKLKLKRNSFNLSPPDNRK